MIPLAEYTEQASVGDWPLRIALTLLVLGCVGLLWLALRRGWRNRLRRQTEFSPPEQVSQGPVEGVRFSCRAKYIGTVVATNLWDRVAAGGLAAQAEISISDKAVRVTRQGAADLPISRGSIRSVGVGNGMLQKAFRKPGLLMITWEWSAQEVTSGFWIADPQIQAAAITELTAVAGLSHGSGVKEG